MKNRVFGLYRTLENLREVDSERRPVETNEGRPKFSYSCDRSKSKIKIPVCPMFQYGEVLSVPGDVSNVLRKQYESLFSTPEYRELEINANGILCWNGCPNDFVGFNITAAYIVQSKKKISSTSAAGPDGYPALLVDKLCYVLARQWYHRV